MIVGIDLGTTHSAMASVDPSSGPRAKVEDFPVPQLVRPGEVNALPLLPSCVYLPGPELPSSARGLPWGASEGPVTGELARWQGARVPARLIASAKSWLSHAGVDRSAKILPWAAPADSEKLSPVEASARLLGHLVSAWNFAHPRAQVAEQEVVLTVPASFDEAARALTVSAARAAGISKFTLLEEPQAAFYDFTSHHREKLETALRGIRLVLVVDVGGGTSDFTLVHAGLSPEGPLLKRLAVGDHLLLGGDNMDTALAHLAERKLSGEGKKLSATGWTQLIQASKAAKEALLGAGAKDRFGLSVTEGGRLLGGARSTELSAAEAESCVLDGFFPKVSPSDGPRRTARMGVMELGLPYAQDPAITRHVVGFLRRHAAAGFTALSEQPTSEDALPRPDAILLNGGVFNSPRIAQRLVEAISALWPSASEIPLLPHGSLDRAVARGAAYYGLVRKGHGLKIGGGAARAFYVGLESEGGSKALCLVPRGFEEGQTAPVGERRFHLTLGRPVQFQLYSTTADRIDVPGDVVDLSEELKALPPIHAVLQGKPSQGKATGEIPVRLEATLTEIGTLELWCADDSGQNRWRLEFELRGGTGPGRLAVVEALPARFAEATELVERIYGHKPLPVGPKDVKQLLRNLEKVLGARDTWRVPVLRELWGTLHAGAAKRRRSADHERIFWLLSGYCLRPGFGYPLDGWRSERLFELFAPLISAHGEKAVWIEFWICWRRIAGGLEATAQQALWDYLRPHLRNRLLPQTGKSPKLKGIVPEGLDEMVRCAASLEHLEVPDKLELGEWIAGKLSAAGGPWAWALGRIGARVPLHGSGHKVIPPEAASAWLERLLELGLKKVDGAPFAAAQMARRTGDRTRDLDEALVARTLSALEGAKAPQSWLRMVKEVVALEAADEARALGDTLPSGLRLD